MDDNNRINRNRIQEEDQSSLTNKNMRFFFFYLENQSHVLNPLLEFLLIFARQLK